ncbi:MAG: hypothetical protein KJ629_03300 [Candidatus Omnitrophica bacterium]|nr:hypothetical protein [Candidatus Omnitrophota bacterium]
MKRKILVGLAAAVSVGVVVWLAYAAVSNWPFTLSSNYTVSDSNKVEVAGGVAKLKELTESQDTQAELKEPCRIRQVERSVWILMKGV